MSFPRYPSYKDSGVEWLGEVPGHWEVLPIKRIVSIPITDGPHETPQFVVDGVPFVSAEAVSSGRIDFSKIRACITAEDNARYSLKYSPKLHDIYMVKSGATTGVTAIVEDRTDFNIWSPLAVIRCGEKAVPHFVLNFMRSQNFLEAVTLNWSFGTQQNIGMGVIENLFCTLPPLPEQTQIAAFLDRETAKIDALVAEQRRLMDILKEKRQAVISHAVTRGLNPNAPMKPSGIEWLGDVPAHWEIKSIAYILDAIGDVDHFMPASVEKGVPYLMTGDLKEYVSDVSLDDCKQVSHDNYLELSKRIKSSKGDVIMARYATIGTLMYVDIDVDFLVSYSCVTLKTNNSKVSGFYLFQYMKSNAFRHGVENQINTNTQGNVGIKDLQNVKIAVPPIDEQTAIAAFLGSETTKFDTLITGARSAIDLLLERRIALISAAVTGQIDVRGMIPSL